MAGPSDRLAQPKSLLFLCDRNAVRSPYAEAVMRARSGAATRVRSAGVEAAEETDAFMVAVAREEGVDLTGHRPASLADLATAGDDLSDVDMIVALSRTSEQLALELAQQGTDGARAAGARVVFWPVPDPSDVGETRLLRLAAYRDCCARIRAALDAAFPR